MSRKPSTTVTQMPELMNAEQIAKRRVPLEDAEVTVATRSKWKCTYCQRNFGNETMFMKHPCEPRRRAQELASPLGQAAYGYYRDWMKLKKFSQPGAMAFMESKYYRAFINFAQMVIDANVSRPDKYMQIMVDCDVLPILWCRDQAYALYLAWSDKLANPLELVQNSVEYLIDLSEKEGVELDKIFEHLGAQQVLSLIRQRRLTPWLLFCSTCFDKQILKKLDPSQLVAFNAVVNAQYWAGRFAKEKATLEEVKTIVKGIGL